MEGEYLYRWYPANRWPEAGGTGSDDLQHQPLELRQRGSLADLGSTAAPCIRPLSLGKDSPATHAPFFDVLHDLAAEEMMGPGRPLYRKSMLISSEAQKILGKEKEPIFRVETIAL